MKPKIVIKIQHYPGYGSSPQWEVFAIWENVLLDSKLVGSEFEAGRTEGQFRSKWEKDWSKKAWEKATRNKKAASRLCGHCGGHTQDGCISCVDMLFCYKCKPLIEQYKKEYQDRVASKQVEWEKEQAEKENRRVVAVNARLTGFHWRDDWYFKRLADGSVNILHFHRDPSFPYIDKDLVVPSNEWASIVCSVSKDGETAERWDTAQDFHGRVKF